MELKTNHGNTTCTMRLDLATAHSDPKRVLKRVLHRSKPEVGEKSGSYETALAEPAVTVRKKMVAYFMEHVLAARIVNRAAEEVAVTLFEGGSHDIEHESQPLLKTLAKSWTG